MSINVIQYSNIPFEIFTIDNLYTNEEIELYTQYIEDAYIKNRTFTNNEPFKNGKLIYPEWSSLMYERINPYLPKIYNDANGVVCKFIESPKYIMYKKVISNQNFGIHTDTGCEYNIYNNKYSKFTVLTYLNDDYEGGYTTFYDDQFNQTVSIKPQKNRTLIFDIELFHSGEMVLNGSKYWIGTELVCSKNI
jgi:hypothetical protein